MEANIKTEPEEVKTKIDLDGALTSKPRVKSDKADKFRAYVVLDGPAAVVVKAACKKAGIDGNLASWLKGLMLADLKRRLAKPEVKTG